MPPSAPPRDPRELADGKLLVDSPAAHVVRLTISNPAKRNALDHPILDAITATLAELAGGGETVGSDPAGGGAIAGEAGGEADGGEAGGGAADGGAAGGGEADGGEARCVIVTGAHGMFSAGYEIGGITDASFQEEAERLVAHPFTAAIQALAEFPYPTLASLPGHTIGGGLELALACDLRIGAEEIKLGMPPAKLGLVYSHTGLRRFIDAIGAARTRELFLVGSYIDAATALRWGLVNRLSPSPQLESDTLALAAELAGNAPLSQLGNKSVIAALLSAEGALSEDVEAELIELRRASFASRDLREGMSAFAEKRAPRWRGE